MVRILNIGFIIEPYSKDIRDIVKGMALHLQENKNTYWKAYPIIGKSSFIPRLFILSELAYRVCYKSSTVQGNLKHTNGKVIIESDNELNYLTRYLFDVKTKKGKYKSIQDEVLINIIKVFMPIGKKANVTLCLNNEYDTNSFFFWTEYDFIKNTHLTQFPSSKDHEYFDIKDTISKSTIFDGNLLFSLSQHLIDYYQPKGQTWIDLCNQYTFESEYSPELDSWLVIKCINLIPKPPDSTEKLEFPFNQEQAKNYETIGPWLELCEVLKQHGHVLLTGVAGTGKTTSLKLLMNYYHLHNQRKPKRFIYPFFMDLRWFERYAKSKLDFKGIDIIEGLSNTFIYNLKEIVGLDKLVRLFKIGKFTNKYDMSIVEPGLVLEEIRNVIKKDIIRWIHNKSSENIEIVILLDNFDGVSSSFKPYVKSKIVELFDTKTKVLVACRSYFSSHYFSDQPMLRYELQTLNNDHIISYLESFPS